MDLLINLNIDCSKATDLRLIFKSRWMCLLHEWFEDGDFKKDSIIKSCLTPTKKQISTITKLDLQAAVLANKMKVIISKSSRISINKVHLEVQTQRQRGSISIRKT